MKIEGISYLKHLLIYYKEFTTIGKDGVKKYSFDWKLQYDDTNITVERCNLETMQIHTATVLINYWNISIKIAKKIVKYNDLQGAVNFCFENLLVQNLREV